mgnify:CR=1 FL=1
MSMQTFAQWKSYYPDGTTRKNTKKGLKNNVEKDNNSFKFNTHFYNALSFKALENFEEALKEFEKCININPENSVPYYESAIIYKQFSQEESALEFSKNELSQIYDYAKKLDTALSLAGRDFDFKRKGQGWFLTADHALAGFYPLPSLQGQHQIQNAAACIHLLAKIQEKIPVSKKNIEYGLQHIALMGRLQQIRNSPDVYLDVAHNAESALALARFIRKQHCTGTVHAVFSVLADKQFDQVIEPFIGVIDQWHIAPIENARSISMTDLGQFLSGKLRQNCSRYQTIGQAFMGAENRLNEDDLVICFGSFYVVEACLEAL